MNNATKLAEVFKAASDRIMTDQGFIAAGINVTGTVEVHVMESLFEECSKGQVISNTDWPEQRLIRRSYKTPSGCEVFSLCPMEGA